MKTDREEIVKILRDNITFSPQTNNYVIHGAIDKLIEYFKNQSQPIEKEQCDYCGGTGFDPYPNHDTTMRPCHKCEERRDYKYQLGLANHTILSMTAKQQELEAQLKGINKALESSPTEQPEHKEPYCSGKPYCCPGERCKALVWQDQQNQPQEEQSYCWNDVCQIVAPYHDNSGPENYKKMIDCLNKNFTITRKHHD